MAHGRIRVNFAFEARFAFQILHVVNRSFGARHVGDVSRVAASALDQVGMGGALHALPGCALIFLVFVRHFICGYIGVAVTPVFFSQSRF